MSEVTTSLNYFVPPLDGSKPWIDINPDPKSGRRGANFDTEAFQSKILNIRGHEHEYSLDKNGFEFFEEPTKEKEFKDVKSIENNYYAEQSDLIKKLTGASRVVMFDHTIRHHKPGDTEDTPDNRHPVPRVHVDQTAQSAEARVHRHLPASDVPGLLARRYQIINLWRPIRHAALDYPLALCDFQTIDEKNDLIPTTLRYPDRDGETFSVRYNPRHQWIYQRGMRPDEGVLIKCFDSIQDGSVAVLTPHTAFVDPTTPEGAPLRASIELRALVFYD
ncbi:hypothetical protein SISNIDRAFT_528139 [Sistotremastrum niveocremeum HHB9708]|uniref:7alpha-cephem-methoxylase P8 chain related protein n=1 Tax=Sistotremastrum niveocremeum HHB9708 TaxID=1314777 RepID=A0A164PYY7_9AGAM|nr:hypothetical protein SISNIDRAFT_528139 [Sistotremastrum niveocremeum HHB9708]